MFYWGLSPWSQILFECGLIMHMIVSRRDKG